MTTPPIAPFVPSFRRTGVYLDHNATAPLKPEVKAAMGQAMDLVGNPSSVHAFGRSARRAVEEARAAVASLVGVKPAQVLFTGSGTEANNFALRGFPGRRLLTSAIEHESVLAARPDADRFGVSRDGVADLDDLERRLAGSDAPPLVSLMLVNNETGVIQPVADAARIARAHAALLHCDAVQAAGRLPLSLSDLGVDLMTLSAHKLGGPTGVGALILAEGLEPETLIRGGGQERRKRAGTENLLGIVGFGTAARLACDGLADAADLAALRDRLEREALAAIPRARVMGAGAARVANTSCLMLPGLPGETQVMTLDLAGVAVSAGSACSSGKVKPSHVLAAMGEDDRSAASAIRVSLGWISDDEAVDRFLTAWTAMARRSTPADG
ncbi:cysteine desulfurase [Azospirillum sp. TSH100]|uniref:cysteine desulfurase family protein n=1 Tax=Azospirillum sp. TSH100 TaxID=652764 RepID=UPI000D613864|nr:cysteine desulfurase family protein [Azospirillum sp. TSH100]PWC86636.1 cysteine desulfurase [Azospirillum sp. TSH100]QCG86299.1 cysteine desulfurase [Azospirillum sp. TSH100]